MKPYATLQDCFPQLVDDISTSLRKGISKRGHATLAVSGGRTPEHIFPPLAQVALDWSRVSITLADERWVDPDHSDSNEALARKLLLQGPAAAARFVGLKTSHVDPFDGLDDCSKSLEMLNWPLDAVFLGMGEDGHIASLFPGPGDGTDAPGRALAVAASETRKPRMSLTPAALLDSRIIYLVITGREKRLVFDRALEPGPVSELPVRLIIHQQQVPLVVYAVD